MRNSIESYETFFETGSADSHKESACPVWILNRRPGLSGRQRSSQRISVHPEHLWSPPYFTTYTPVQRESTSDGLLLAVSIGSSPPRGSRRAALRQKYHYLSNVSWPCRLQTGISKRYSRSSSIWKGHGVSLMRLALLPARWRMYLMSVYAILKEHEEKFLSLYICGIFGQKTTRKMKVFSIWTAAQTLSINWAVRVNTA